MAGYVGMKWTRKERPEELQKMMAQIEDSYFKTMTEAVEQAKQTRMAKEAEEERLKRQVAYGILMMAVNRGNIDKINEACDRCRSLGMYID